MTIILRIYASYDADLIALRDQGIAIATFAQNVLEAYAYDKPLYYVVPEGYVSDARINETFRTRFDVEDERVLNLLSSIRPKKRNLFIKTLMRNALARQNLSPFFIKSSVYYDKEQSANDELTGTYPRLVRGRKRITLEEMVDETLAPKTPKKESRIKNQKTNEAPAAAITEPADKPADSPVADMEPIDEPKALSIDIDKELGPVPKKEPADIPADDDDILAMLQTMTDGF